MACANSALLYSMDLLWGDPAATAADDSWAASASSLTSARVSWRQIRASSTVAAASGTDGMWGGSGFGLTASSEGSSNRVCLRVAAGSVFLTVLTWRFDSLTPAMLLCAAATVAQQNEAASVHGGSFLAAGQGVAAAQRAASGPDIAAIRRPVERVLEGHSGSIHRREPLKSRSKMLSISHLLYSCFAPARVISDDLFNHPD